ncbi:peptidoglycan-binding protein [Pelagibacterium montanilacus]|uniref:peptidoglycan-binding protein n=1 Tax=Pelagibacterium montanilacus TaxID=2185280 RepID=UPI0013DFE898|nr:peptidoglycan-binding protein [Pelagibacterium montanilacus]
MTASSLTHIPLSIGSALLALSGRGLSWGAAQVMAAPMASAVLFTASGLVLMAGTNALYLQEGKHPAPMFSVQGQQAADAPPAIAPVMATPPIRPEGLEMASVPPPASASPTPAPQPEPPSESTPAIGNADIAELQERLSAMGLFDGTVDGYYGPKTADAIRAFEARSGLPRTGAASPDVLRAVRSAGDQSSAAPVPTPSPAPEPTPVAAPAQTAVASAPSSSDDIASLIAAAPVEQRPAPEPAPAAAPAPVQAVAAPEPQAEAVASVAASDQEAIPPARDRELVRAVQSGLLRLGFMHAPATGVLDDTTAQAIRKFQIFHNYRVTGEITPQLLDRLALAGGNS